MGSSNVGALEAAWAEGRKILTEPEVYSLLDEAGIAVPRQCLVPGPEDVTASLVEGLGSDEVVVKIVSPQVLHKSEVGGVAVVRSDVHSVREAVSGVLAQVRQSCGGEIDVHGVLIAER